MIKVLNESTTKKLEDALIKIALTADIVKLTPLDNNISFVVIVEFKERR